MPRRLIYPLIILALGVAVVVAYLFSGAPDANVIVNIRLPRLILTLYTGMVLAAVGSVYQLMLANPLAEPYILGVSSGSAFGAILTGVLGLTLLMPVGGFLGAGITLLVVWSLARRKGSFDRSRLLIAGVIAGMFFSAGISLLMYLFQKDSMVILGTLMGNLGHVFTFREWNFFLGLLAISLLLMIWLYFKSTALDILSGGDIYAGSVGIDVPALRKKVFIVSSLLIGITVSFAGIIGFVGLIIPHIVRFFIPSGQKRIYLYSLLSGGVFLLLCDLIAKNIAVIELPVGVITAAVGCPFFMWLMLRK
ncbi:MAG TPA: iron ABC transporter permease [Candidatus Cloacimonadota bacterium]|jgi:iron complex transport system permease protein|nr:iron ABC transporter permease [Candidatus Cloacimonadota bacterium]HOG30816.1 iron ABC transporter permease [Candidatus Cloacimonadota bacterium]HOR58335.1 iron ABC transporter permease [Candidatus Cloacimonadota bacterium]HPB09271.1 iron ABC transporter permease [Candidatus Cloacimonadota bacterium]HPL23786.1 iron ABC transporter permease [Candidatus Cloacimonadota bacterium]